MTSDPQESGHLPARIKGMTVHKLIAILSQLELESEVVFVDRLGVAHSVTGVDHGVVEFTPLVEMPMIIDDVRFASEVENVDDAELQEVVVIK